MSNSKAAIVLKRNGSSVKEIKIPSNINLDKLDISLFPDKYVNGAKISSIERECDFDYIDKTISIFAFNDGKAGHENKTELPPPLDKQLYFNNIFVIGHNNNKIVDLNKSEYEEFYETSFGGFDNIDSEDSWSEEEESNSDDREFIVNDSEEIEEGEESNEEDEYISEEDTEVSEDEPSLESENSSVEKTKKSISKKKRVNNKKKENDVQKKKKDKKKSKIEKMSIQDEEKVIIDEYVNNISTKFSDSPSEFKDILYKHHDRNPKYVLKWLVFKLENSPEEYKDIYLNYRQMVDK